MSQFNPIEVPIVPKLNYLQVELILEGLGKLPFERVDQFYTSLRELAISTLTEAEAAYRAAHPDDEAVPAESEGGEAE